MKLKTMPLGLLAANSYLLWNEKSKQAVIIDCGGEADKVVDFLTARGLSLQYIILTHGHSDHIMGVNDLKAATAATVIAHGAERDMLADPAKNYSAMFGGQPTTVEADCYIEADQTKMLIDYQFTFYHTPGHTRGGMCILVGDYLFTGDTLFRGSVGRTDLYGGNMAVLRKSLQKLTKLSHRLTVYSGHGLASTLRDEVRDNPFLQ